MKSCWPCERQSNSTRETEHSAPTAPSKEVFSGNGELSKALFIVFFLVRLKRVLKDQSEYNKEFLEREGVISSPFYSIKAVHSGTETSEIYLIK